MTDSIAIGSTPWGEECAQVGSANYRERALKECHEYARQLGEMYPPRGDGWLAVGGCGHDFGTYYEVRACYSEDDSEAMAWAIECEEGCELWDSKARKALGLKGGKR